MSEEPNYSRLAARLLATFIDKEVANQNIHSFSQSIAAGHDAGLIADDTAALVANHSYKLNEAIDTSSDYLFEYFGLRTVYDRYLLRHPERRLVIETPQYWFMRVACGLSSTADEAIEFYRLISSLDYLPATPTLFNAGTTHPQLSSCYLLDSPSDTLEAIYDRYKDVARLSKFAGGIGLAFHRVRSRGSLIRGTNGLSNGIVPWLKTLDSSVSAVNQGGKRKGAACVYLETWHADIEEFLELKDNVGDEARRTHNLNLANWVPDLFMERVEKDWSWSLFDPKKVPHLTDLFGAEFERAYVEAESQKLYERQVPARQLYARMMRTLAQTGNGWMTFKDPANARCNQTADAARRRARRAIGASAGRPSVQPLHGDPRGDQRRRDGGVQPRLDQPRALRRRRPGHRRRRVRLPAPRRRRPHRRAVPRPGDRHQLLPDRRGQRVELAVAAGGPRRDGPAGRVLPHAPAVRLPRRLATSHGGSPRRSTSTPCPRRATSPPSPVPTPPSPRRASPAGRSSSSLPAINRATRSAGRRCGHGSPSTACATRC